LKQNLEAPRPVFAGSFLNDEYIPSRNIQDLEKQSGIFLILNVGMEWISPSCTGRPWARGPRRGWRTRPGLAGRCWFWVQAAAVVLGILPPQPLDGALGLPPWLLSDLPLATS